MADRNPLLLELETQLADRSEYVRRGAVEQLARLGAEAGDLLLTALSDRAALVREGAALALGDIGEPRAIGPLIPCLRDESQDVQRAAKRALVRIGGSEVRPLLWALKDPDKNVRRSAAEILAEIGPPTVPPLLEALKDENVLVRCNAAWSLGKIGDSSVAAFLAVMLKDSNVDARRIALWALGQFGNLSLLPRHLMAQTHLTTGQRMQALTAVFDNPHPDIASAIRLPAPTIKDFCQTLLRDRDPNVQQHAREVLAALILVRASHRESVSDPAMLLRPAQDSGTKETGSLLRASEPPDEPGK